ncbi:hypothetical protein LRP88_11110 [Fusarium phalaenopsidis]
MTERRPPTPATGDDSLSMGPPKKFLEAEECALISGQGPSSPNSQADNQDADAGRRSTFRDSADRARGMFSGIRLPAFRFPSARWWYRKLKLLVKAVIILAVIFAEFKLVHGAPQLREIIASKFESITQGRSHTDHFTADRDHFNMGKDRFGTDKSQFNADKEQVKAGTHNSEASQDRSKATKNRAKAAKDQFETNRDNIKTDKGQFKFDKNADGNHIRGSWTKPDDTRITFEASKTSGDHVTEIKFVQSEEQFIKDENDKVLFSLNRITRFFMTLIGGDEHDEKLDKVSEFAEHICKE